MYVLCMCIVETSCSFWYSWTLVVYMSYKCVNIMAS